MGRLIDADALISKEERRELDKYIDGERCYEMVVPTWAIYEAPTIDAVSVVRCKECRHNYNKVLNHGKMKPRCDFTDRVLTENDFCSRGEREGE